MARAKNDAYYSDLKLTVSAFDRLQDMRLVADELGVNASTVSRRLKEADELNIRHDSDMEIVLTNVRLAKQKQGLQDVQRIANKAFREHARVENAVTEYVKELTNAINVNKPFHKLTKKSPIDEGEAVLLLHWSDHHLNERVELAHNTYDWNVASRRLRKHVTSAKRIAKAYGINHIHLQFTGDLLNSDRRLDELLANAGNRAKASILAVDLYSQAILDLAHDYDVTVSGISGNESRLGKDVGWTAEGATDNYDFAIYEMLDLLIGDDVRILRPQNPSESVISLAGQNILCIHGHGGVGVNNLQKAVQEVKGRYIANGIKVDMVIWGHIHECVVADWYARSSSLVGSNTFNENALNLAGRASQNCYVIHRGGGFDGIKIDLQNTDGIEGYDLDERLHAYNTKAAAKLHQPLAIMEIVI
jgi:predicted phosphodiesterase